jgi:hypothetical protein
MRSFKTRRRELIFLEVEFIPVSSLGFPTRLPALVLPTFRQAQPPRVPPGVVPRRKTALYSSRPPRRSPFTFGSARVAGETRSTLLPANPRSPSGKIPLTVRFESLSLEDRVLALTTGYPALIETLIQM